MKKIFKKEKLLSYYRLTVLIILIIMVWEVLARQKYINTQVLSSPKEVCISFLHLLNKGSIIIDLFSSVKRVMIGVAIGSFIGVIFGIILSLSKKTYDYLSLLIEFIRPIPPIAWIPIAILWFGIGDIPAYFLVSLGAFFPVYTNVYKSMKNMDKKYIDISRSLGASNILIFRKVIVPMLLPDLISGIKVGLGVGWIIVITAEMVGAQNGLGYMIQINRIMLQTPNVIVGMIVIGLFGAFISQLMNLLEKYIIPWKNRMELSERNRYE